MDIKERIRRKAGYASDQIWLSYNSRRLHEDQTLHDCQVLHTSTVYVLLKARWVGREHGAEHVRLHGYLARS
jgi:hypothetical protein